LALGSVRYVYEAVGDKVDIIGMGGIDSAEQAMKMIRAGASAIGINTAVRALGAKVMNKIEMGLSDKLWEPGVHVRNLSEVIGADTKRKAKSLNR
jgi:dihydroorotate dehydrogenase